MLRSLFGSKAQARVFMPPGLTLPASAVQAHQRRHPAALGQAKAGQTQNFIVFSDGTADGDAADLEARPGVDGQGEGDLISLGMGLNGVERRATLFQDAPTGDERAFAT